MSLKGIELQIALPKTFEAGKLAEEKQQRIHTMQENANLQTEKQAQKDKETVLETEKNKLINADDESNKQEHEQEKKQRSKKTKNTNESSQHPYKGSFVDYSG